MRGGFLAVPQDAPQNLAGRRLRDLVDHLDAPDLFVRRDPRRDDQTICTAVAPEAVRTVRTYATDAGYGSP